MKKVSLSALSLYASLCGLCLANVVPVAAATRYSMASKTITLGGQVISRPQGFAANKTTYMPIYYVMLALTKLGIQNEWNGSVWNLLTLRDVKIGNPGGSGKNEIEANGHCVYQVNGIVTQDPASKKNTTYMPVWYVMQVLTDIGVGNSWDGENWSIPGASSNLKSTNGSSSVTAKSQNQATDDSAYWNRSSKNLYVMASTNADFSQTAAKPMLSVEPSDSVHLMAYSDTKGLNAKPVWYVNSKDAKITNDTPGDWTYGSYEARSATFTASEPGIYTVQFSVAGAYSVPFVVIVGMDSLGGTSIPVQASSSGVLPLPTGLPAVLQKTIDNITFYPNQPVSGWLPVSGHVTGTASTMVVDLENDAGDEWTYVLPVQNGVFKGMVRVPFQGNVEVSLVPDFWNALNQSNGEWSTNVTYSEAVTAAAPSELEKGLLSSAMMDWNMSTEFNATASILADNSMSRDTAIAAISNYVSEKVAYDFADYKANKFIWKNSTDTWQNPLGVCEDISELTASMLKSIGIPAETLVGTTTQDSTPDDHEWIRAYDGTGWIVIDPTWNGSGGTINSSLLNEYLTNTDSLSGSHVLDSTESYTWQ